MNAFRLIEKSIWVVGIALILCLNIYGAVPSKYKTHFRPIGADSVRVVEARSEEQDMLNPLQTQVGDIKNKSESETGRRVKVYIRTTYKDDIVNFYPRTTLKIAGAMTFLPLATRLLFRTRAKNEQNVSAGA